jgi:hypothetical protein
MSVGGRAPWAAVNIYECYQGFMQDLRSLRGLHKYNIYLSMVCMVHILHVGQFADGCLEGGDGGEFVEGNEEVG